MNSWNPGNLQIWQALNFRFSGIQIFSDRWLEWKSAVLTGVQFFRISDFQVFWGCTHPVTSAWAAIRSQWAAKTAPTRPQSCPRWSFSAAGSRWGMGRAGASSWTPLVGLRFAASQANICLNCVGWWLPHYWGVSSRFFMREADIRFWRTNGRYRSAAVVQVKGQKRNSCDPYSLLISSVDIPCDLWSNTARLKLPQDSDRKLGVLIQESRTAEYDFVKS
jgi:hypothetical protein